MRGAENGPKGALFYGPCWSQLAPKRVPEMPFGGPCSSSPYGGHPPITARPKLLDLERQPVSRKLVPRCWPQHLLR
eukprot:8677824-Pyramimonas_sp.AAC.1